MENKNEEMKKTNGETVKDVEGKVKESNDGIGVLTELPVAPKNRNSIGSLNSVAEHSEDAENTGKEGETKVDSVVPNKTPVEATGSGTNVTTAPTRRIPHLHKLEK